MNEKLYTEEVKELIDKARDASRKIGKPLPLSIDGPEIPTNDEDNRLNEMNRTSQSIFTSAVRLYEGYKSPVSWEGNNGVGDYKVAEEAQPQPIEKKKPMQE